MPKGEQYYTAEIKYFCFKDSNEQLSEKLQMMDFTEIIISHFYMWLTFWSTSLTTFACVL